MCVCVCVCVYVCMWERERERSEASPQNDSKQKRERKVWIRSPNKALAWVVPRNLFFAGTVMMNKRYDGPTFGSLVWTVIVDQIKRALESWLYPHSLDRLGCGRHEGRCSLADLDILTVVPKDVTFVKKWSSSQDSSQDLNVRDEDMYWMERKGRMVHLSIQKVKKKRQGQQAWLPWVCYCLPMICPLPWYSLRCLFYQN